MKKKVKRPPRNPAVLFMVLIMLTCSCREIAVPKPKGYFRIDLPEKNYRQFNSDGSRKDLPLQFEYPTYGTISSEDSDSSEPGWFDIEFSRYRAKIYLTYMNVKGDLAGLIEQTYAMNVKNHIVKADAINETTILDKENRIFGILYDLKGNTATAVQFYTTDSTRHFLRGSLYFNSEPNADSLAPVIDFFREDIIHLIETLKWR